LVLLNISGKFTVKEDELFLVPVERAAAISTNIKTGINIWKQYCLQFESSNNLKLISQNGTYSYKFETDIGSNTNEDPPETNEEPPEDSSNDGQMDFSNLEFIFGPNQIEVLIGTLADIQIYRRSVFDEVVDSIGECDTTISNAMNCSGNDSDFSSDGVTISYLSQKEALCVDSSKRSQIFTLDNERGADYDAVNKYCQNLGGRLPSISQDDVGEIAERYFYSFRNVGPKIDIIWFENDINSSTCRSIIVKRLNDEQYTYQNETKPCSTPASGIVCILSPDFEITFKNNRIMSHSLKPVIERNRIMFFSDSHEFFGFKKCTEMNYCLAYMAESLEVFMYKLDEGDKTLSMNGRRNWTLTMDSSNFDNPENSMKYVTTTSVCTSNQYTCDDGDCIHLSTRCNGQIDCKDASDEDGTCSYVLPLTASYKKNLCPDTTNPKIHIIVESYGVKDLLLDTNELEIFLRIDLQWKDQRLEFSGLEPFKGYSLSSDYLDQLWAPNIFATNGRYMDNFVLSTKANLMYEMLLSTDTIGNGSFSEGRERKSL